VSIGNIGADSIVIKRGAHQITRRKIMTKLATLTAHWRDIIRNKRPRAVTPAPALDRYIVTVPAELLAHQPELIDQIITFALDTLDVHYLDLRVCSDS